MSETVGLILVIALGVLSVWAGVVLLMARARMYPPRLTPLRALFMLGRASAKDLGFEHEPMAFVAQAYGRPVTLKASLVRHHSADGVLVILLHGYGDSSAGALAWLGLLHRQAVNVLLLDLPGHGESDTAPCTAGWIERQCVWEVIDQLRQSQPEVARHVILYGLSMGAAVALAAARYREGIAGVILDSPYADFRNASVLHAALFGLPGSVFQTPANWVIARKYSIDFDAVAPEKLLQAVSCPVLLIQSGKDCLVSRAAQEAMSSAVLSRRGNAAVTVGQAHHLLALADDAALYESEVSKYLSTLKAHICQH